MSKVATTNAAVSVTPIKKISQYVKDISTINVDKNDIRFTIQTYYQIQTYRISLASQIRSINQSEVEDVQQHQLLDWLFSNMVQLEDEIKKAIAAYVHNDPVGQWLEQVIGIGPVLAGGLLCYFDVHKAPSVSHFYSYAGLNDNNVQWLGKEQATKLVNKYVSTEITDSDLMNLAQATKRHFSSLVRMCDDNGKRNKTKLIKELSKPPYNKELKMLCWKIGESFVKVSGKEESLYGRLYRERKALEEVKNEQLAYKDQAQDKLENNNIGKTTEAYKHYSAGKLPPSHIASRAKRYAVKIFISHLYDEMYRQEFKKEPARAYVFEHLGHVDVIPPEVPSMANLK